MAGRVLRMPTNRNTQKSLANSGLNHGEAEVLARTLGDQQRLGRIATFMVLQCLVTGDYAAAVRFGQEGSHEIDISLSLSCC
jgi:hypothetical protein